MQMPLVDLEQPGELALAKGATRDQQQTFQSR
jgi:hypothetical protein